MKEIEKEKSRRRRRRKRKEKKKVLGSNGQQYPCPTLM